MPVSLADALIEVRGVTTTTVALPITGLVAPVSLLYYGAYKGYEYLEKQKA